MHSTSARLRTFGELHGNLGDGWQQVAQEPAPFLALQLAIAVWLERALPLLVQAGAQVRIDGNELIHLDVRSDNLCRTSRGVVLIDWNHACLGNGAVDTGFWLPSLEAEGGPPPEDTLPNRPEIAAYVSGFFAARAGLPPVRDAPSVRAVQLQQLKPALLWAARELALRRRPRLPNYKLCGGACRVFVPRTIVRNAARTAWFQRANCRSAPRLGPS